jgi:hypothetical protein
VKPKLKCGYPGCAETVLTIRWTEARFTREGLRGKRNEFRYCCVLHALMGQLDRLVSSQALGGIWGKPARRRML